ncbi:MAG: response regulator transcription factor [Verrucomicrobia bacterium]|nr:response regulator transcription factor [Verrucomicrobiota bacterium]
MGRIRIVLADDHAVVRSGLKFLIQAQPDMEVVGEAEDGVVAIECCRKMTPDVLVIDLSMPGLGGVAAVEELRHANLGVKSLALTMHEDAAYLRQFLNAGGTGYVLKKAAGDTLINAIRTVSRGGTYVPPTLAAAVLDEPVRTSRRSGNGGAAQARLTDREQEVLALIALGNTNREIAGRLHISEKTVETHRAHILEKLNLKTRADLVRYAIEHGLMQG